MGRKARPLKRHYKENSIIALADAGLTYAEIAIETGIGARQVRHVLERERTRRTTEPVIDPATLSKTAQEKLNMAVRQHRRQLDLTFEQRVREEIHKRLDQIVLPEWKRQIAEAKQIYESRKGIMDKATFNRIRRGLHPDSRKSISDGVLGEAFDAFMGLEKKLLDEKESPTPFAELPDTYEGWMKVRRPQRVRPGMASMSKRS